MFEYNKHFLFFSIPFFTSSSLFFQIFCAWSSVFSMSVGRIILMIRSES